MTWQMVAGIALPTLVYGYVIAQRLEKIHAELEVMRKVLELIHGQGR